MSTALPLAAIAGVGVLALSLSLPYDTSIAARNPAPVWAGVQSEYNRDYERGYFDGRAGRYLDRQSAAYYDGWGIGNCIKTGWAPDCSKP